MGTGTHRASTLLVVDDDGKFRTFALESLAGEEIAVTSVGSGREALDAWNTGSYDLILLNLKLPDMSGKDVFKSLLEKSSAPDVMIVANSKDIDAAVELLKLGAKEYFTKPIDPADFVQRVKSALRSRMAEQRLKHLHSEFESRLMHDLRSPLRTIGSTLDYLKNDIAGMLSQQQQLLLENMKASITQMDTLLSDMIDFNLLESGTAEMEKLPTNLDELLPAICERFKPRAAAKNITLEFKTRSNIPTIEADPARIEQVFNSLLENGIKHTNAGGSITLTLSPVKLPLNGRDRDCIEITVTDTGVGIPQEEQPLLFDKYKDLLLGKSFHRQTTDLGLAICRNIVDAHNGTITVESESGKGTSFRILLPLEG